MPGCCGAAGGGDWGSGGDAGVASYGYAGTEGIVLKRTMAPYRAGRWSGWLKTSWCPPLRDLRAGTRSRFCTQRAPGRVGYL